MPRRLAVTTFVLILVSALLGSAEQLGAQTPSAQPGQRFAWDQPGADQVTAASYEYRLYIDGSQTGAIVAVACQSVASGVECATPIPALTPGTHGVQVTAALAGCPGAGNLAAPAPCESAPSSSFTFTLIAVPGVPKNVRIR